jgi:hypothetical protein
MILAGRVQEKEPAPPRSDFHRRVAILSGAKTQPCSLIVTPDFLF